MELSDRSEELIVAGGRLVAVGDPHGDMAGLERVLSREDRAGATLVSVGDNVGYADATRSSRMCAELAARRIASVYGNHEEWLGEDGSLAIVRPGDTDVRLSAPALAWCRSLPRRLDLDLRVAPEWSAAVVHHVEPGYLDFVPDDVRRSIRRHGVDLLFVGHTHGPKVFEWTADDEIRVQRLDPAAREPLWVELRAGHRYVVDAGSLAKPAHYPDSGDRTRASYSVLDLVGGRIELHAIGKPLT